MSTYDQDHTRVYRGERCLPGIISFKEKKKRGTWHQTVRMTRQCGRFQNLVVEGVAQYTANSSESLSHLMKSRFRVPKHVLKGTTKGGTYTHLGPSYTPYYCMHCLACYVLHTNSVMNHIHILHSSTVHIVNQVATLCTNKSSI